MNDYLDGLFDVPDEPRLPPHPSSRLPALRRTLQETAVAAAAANGRPVRVTTYVLGDDDAALVQQRAELVAFAAEMDWLIASHHFGEVRRSTSRAQPELTAALRYVGNGFSRGILMPGRSSVRCTDAGYAKILRWLSPRALFIAYPSPVRHMAGRP